MITKVLFIEKVGKPTKPIPKVRLAGNWLKEIGFEYGSLVTADAECGSITLNLRGSGTDTYKSIVTQLLNKRDSRLFHVRRNRQVKKYSPFLEITGQWLTNLGFKIGDFVVMKATNQTINIKPLNLSD